MNPIDDIQLPPFSIDVERAALGCIFLDNDCLADCYLQPKYFYDYKHQAIFERMLKMYKKWHNIDAITIMHEDLIAQEITQDHLLEISSCVMTTSGWEAHQEIIQRKYFLREIIKYAERVKSKAYDPEREYELEAIVKDIKEMSDVIQIVTPRETLEDAITNIVLNIGETQPTICPFNFYELDQACLGYKAGQLIIIAARPSSGKTTFALNLARKVAENDKKALFLSLEMTTRELATNIIAHWSQIENRSIANAVEQTMLISEKAEEGMAKLWGRLTVIDNVSTTMEIINTIRKQRIQYGLDVVYIDYVGIVKYPKKDLLAYEIGEFTRGLKQLAKELDISVVLLAQLNRESTKKNEPNLEDLRDSGALEQDADIVLMMQRDDNYEQVVKAFLRKNRSWPKWEFDIWVKFETADMYSMNQSNLFAAPPI